jgi:hypothetical protein
MEPTLVLAYFNLGRSYSRGNLHRDAIADLRKARSLQRKPRDDDATRLCVCHGRQGERSQKYDCRSLACKTYVPSFYTRAIYTGLRDKDLAFYWLRRAYLERCDYMAHLPKEPATDLGLFP